jgi:lysophospholipase L1-like esterase
MIHTRPNARHDLTPNFIKPQALLLVCLLTFGLRGHWAWSVERPAPDRWAEEMRAFEADDRQNPFPREGIVFVGSSSIRLWDLKASFPDVPTLNRGFGGSHLADVSHYLDLLVCRHRPALIVVYAGDNDIHSGLTPEQVAEDFQRLSDQLRQCAPQCKLLYISIKPSVARWDEYPKMRQANEQIDRICRSQEGRKLVDLSGVMLGTDGRPRPDLFQDDGLHLNDAGYARWTEILKPLVTPRETEKGNE